MIQPDILKRALLESGLNKPTAEYVASHVNAIAAVYNALATPQPTKGGKQAAAPVEVPTEVQP